MSCVKRVILIFAGFLATEYSFTQQLPYRIENVRVTPWRENVEYLTKLTFKLAMSDSKLYLDVQNGVFESELNNFGGQYTIGTLVSTIGLPKDETGRFGIKRSYSAQAIQFIAYRPEHEKELKLRFKRNNERWYHIVGFKNEKIPFEELENFAKGKNEYPFREVFDSTGSGVDYELRWGEKDFKTHGTSLDFVKIEKRNPEDNSTIEISKSNLAKETLEKEVKFLHYAIFGQDKPRNPGEYWSVDAQLLDNFIPTGSLRIAYKGRLVLKAEKVPPQEIIEKKQRTYEGLKIIAVHSGYDATGKKLETSLEAEINQKPIQGTVPRFGKNDNRFILHLDTNFEHIRYVNARLCFENFKGEIPEIGNDLAMKGRMEGRLHIEFESTTEIKAAKKE